MATHDYVIANGTGAAVRSDINDALAAIVSNNSGSSEPATTYAYQWWADTTNNLLKLRNSANNAWITLRELDGTLLMEHGTATAPGLAFDGDPNTGIYRPAADAVGLTTGGAERFAVGGTEAVFNDPSNDVDFRVESNGQTHMLFVDAGSDSVGIGTSSPSKTLHVNSGATNEVARFESSDTEVIVEFKDTTGTASLKCRDDYRFNNSSGELARLDSSGRLLLGATSVYSPTNGGQVPCVVQDAGDHRTALVVNNQTNGSSAGSAVILAAHGQDWQLEATSVLKGNRDFTIKAGTNERLRIDNDGRLLLGTSSARTNFFNSTDAAQLQIEGTDSNNSALSLTRNANSTGYAPLHFAKSRGTSVGSNTIVQSGDFLGGIIFSGSDGSEFVTAAAIHSEVDGTPGANDMPGRLTFHTSADGASSPTERMRLDSSGCLGINATDPNNSNEGAGIQCRKGINRNASYYSPTGQYHGSFGYTDNTNDRSWIAVESNYNQASAISAGIFLSAFHQDANSSACGSTIKNLKSGNALVFSTVKTASSTNNPAVETERARFTSDGHLLIGQTNASFGTAGHILAAGGQAYHIIPDNTVLLLNRQNSDGEIVRIAQDGNTEGSISVSGSTVSYNGGHLARWSQLAAGAERTEILRGSVLSNLDEMCEWGDEENEQLNRMKISDVEGDPNVAGVFQAWDDDDDTYDNDFYCAMTGDFVIRIAQGTTGARGDLLMSAGDGTAKPQDDDIVRSKTIAKVTSTTVSTTYSDGSYCVPCVLMAC